MRKMSDASSSNADDVDTERSTVAEMVTKEATNKTRSYASSASTFTVKKKKTYRTSEKPVFVDVTAMKEKVRQNLYHKPYNVADFYHEKGLFQEIARSDLFERITLAIIALNAIWIWIDTDYNVAPVLIKSHPVFQIAEHLFCFYFAVELFVRFMAFKKKRKCLRDAWFVFDSLLVIMMVFETWVMTIIFLLVVGSVDGGALGNAGILRMARLLRLSRMARMARLLRALPELLIMIKGMWSAMRSVFFTLCLLAIFIYVFGIAFVQLTVDMDVFELYFSTVPLSMYNLLIDGTFLDAVGPMSRDISKESWPCAVLFWVFVLLSALTVMNMLIGVVCEVVSAVAATEKEGLLVNFVMLKMHEVLNSIGQENNDAISRIDFMKVLETQDGTKALQETGVDVVGLVDYIDSLFQDEASLSFSDFMEAILQLRGSNTATVKDIVDLRKYIRHSFQETKDHLAKIEQTLNSLQSNKIISPTQLSSNPPAPLGKPHELKNSIGGTLGCPDLVQEVKSLKLQDMHAWMTTSEKYLQAKMSDLETFFVDELCSVPNNSHCPHLKASDELGKYAGEGIVWEGNQKNGFKHQEHMKLPGELDGNVSEANGNADMYQQLPSRFGGAASKRTDKPVVPQTGWHLNELDGLHSHMAGLVEIVAGLKVLQRTVESRHASHVEHKCRTTPSGVDVLS